MIFENSFELRFDNFSPNGETFVTVFGIFDCVRLCLNIWKCYSFFYNHNMRTCALSETRYNDTTGLTPQAEVKYYSIKQVYPNRHSFHAGVTSKLAAKRQNEENMRVKEPKKPSPRQCETEPTYVNQGAVRKRKYSKNGFPVVIKYECDAGAIEKYKYFSGPKEALCDDQGTWTLPAMTCIPTSCFVKVSDSSGTKILYGGDIHNTKSGWLCQAWKRNTPQRHPLKHSFTGWCYGCGSVEDTGNKCRDMDHQHKPWCYTMDRRKRWEHCDVQECTKDKRCARPPILHGALAQKTELIGQKVHVTYTCYAGFKHLTGRNVSICDMETGIWEWPHLLCASEKCFYYSRYMWNHAIYDGNLSSTRTGRSCQRWDSQRPQDHKATVDLFPGYKNLSELGNKCRETSGKGSNPQGPWCYTTDPKVRFEYCSVPECTFLQ